MSKKVRNTGCSTAKRKGPGRQRFSNKRPSRFSRSKQAGRTKTSPLLSKNDAEQLHEVLKDKVARVECAFDSLDQEVGRLRADLYEFKVGKGYKQMDYESFGDYLKAEFASVRLSSSQLYREASAAVIEKVIAPNSPIGEIPESVLRPLNKLLKRDRKLCLAAWQKALEEKPDNGRRYPTAKQIKAIVEAMLVELKQDLAPCPKRKVVTSSPPGEPCQPASGRRAPHADNPPNPAPRPKEKSHPVPSAAEQKLKAFGEKVLAEVDRLSGLEDDVRKEDGKATRQRLWKEFKDLFREAVAAQHRSRSRS